MPPADRRNPFGKRKVPREPRKPVLLRASLRVGGRERAARVKNLSSHGMMVEAHPAPHVGELVEINVGRVCVTGCTVWRSNSQFGIYSRRRIDVRGFLQSLHGHDDLRACLRDRPVRKGARPQDHRLVARGLQFAGSVGFVVAACAAVAIMLHEFLVEPLQALSSSFTP